jgi:hypothetical protein
MVGTDVAMALYFTSDPVALSTRIEL